MSNKKVQIDNSKKSWNTGTKREVWENYKFKKNNANCGAEEHREWNQEQDKGAASPHLFDVVLEILAN